MSNIKILLNGLIKENPIFVLFLGMCPTLATTTSAINGLSMGLATMAVLICTNFVISCIKKVTPDMVRIPVFIVVIAAFVTILQMFMSAYAPDSVNKALGIYIPLIVVNCIILGRAESFACKNTPLTSIFDAIGIGLGFTLGSLCWEASENCWGPEAFSVCVCFPKQPIFCYLFCHRGHFLHLDIS